MPVDVRTPNFLLFNYISADAAEVLFNPAQLLALRLLVSLRKPDNRTKTYKYENTRRERQTETTSQGLQT